MPGVAQVAMQQGASAAKAIIRKVEGRSRCRSRLTLFVEWAIEDLTFSRGALLIAGSAAADFDFNKEMASEAHRRDARYR